MDLISFGDRLERAISAAGMDKKAFAAAMRVQPPMVSQWMGPKGNPTMATLRRMSRILGVSVDWLVHGPAPEVPVTREELEAGHAGVDVLDAEDLADG